MPSMADAACVTLALQPSRKKRIKGSLTLSFQSPIAWPSAGNTNSVSASSWPKSVESTSISCAGTFWVLHIIHLHLCNIRIWTTQGRHRNQSVPSVCSLCPCRHHHLSTYHQSLYPCPHHHHLHQLAAYRRRLQGPRRAGL